MNDAQNQGGRKKALKELLEGIAMTVLGAVMWMLGGDFTFVEERGPHSNVFHGGGRGPGYHRRGVSVAGLGAPGAARQGRRRHCRKAVARGFPAPLDSAAFL